MQWFLTFYPYSSSRIVTSLSPCNCRGKNLRDGTLSSGKLHLIDLAGSGSCVCVAPRMSGCSQMMSAPALISDSALMCRHSEEDSNAYLMQHCLTNHDVSKHCNKTERTSKTDATGDRLKLSSGFWGPPTRSTEAVQTSLRISCAAFLRTAIATGRSYI